MCCIFSVGFIMSCVTLWIEFLLPFVHGLGHCAYIIMAPIVAVRMRDEMEINRQNIELIDNFWVINECADKYTNVDSDLIT